LKIAGSLCAVLLAVPVCLGAASLPVKAPVKPPETAPAPDPALPRGEVIERLAAQQDPSLTYALYIPSGYRPEQPAPILYAFDAQGNAKDLTARLRAGAERYGWIVASPYAASDRIAMEDNFQIMSGLWADTHARLAVNDRRVYAFGFSGLTRFACMLGLTAPESLAGVIAASGGFPLGHPPARGTPFPFFATVGDKDFNYYELLDLDSKMAALGVPHHVEVFPGAHEWPPEAIATAALGWMELQAMKRGTRAKSPELVAALWNDALARARALEDGGKAVDAVRAYTVLAADFSGLREGKDLDEIAHRRAALEASATFQLERQARAERDRRDREYLERVPKILAALSSETRSETREDSLKQALAELSIPELKHRAAAAPDPEERLAAERLLSAVYVQAALHLPQEAAEHKQYDRAIFDLQIAGEIDPDLPQVPFRLAVTWAQKGERRKALDALALAVEKGWTDLLALESERALDPIRQSDEYRTIVAAMMRRRRP
jgi:tetratricopeptide (TPR) repeat protein